MNKLEVKMYARTYLKKILGIKSPSRLIEKEIVGKNLLEKELISTGIEPPKLIGITEKQYYEYEKLQQENKQLKDNWNKLKEWCKGFETNEFNYNFLVVTIKDLLDKMWELEKGDKNN